MKRIFFLTTALCTTLLFTSCDKDDSNPTPVNEEEVITTLNVILIPEGGDVSNAITLNSRDLDGEGPNDAVVTISGDLQAGTTYNGTITLLNETETPAENITEEVAEENLEHQFFYTIGGSLDATTTYADTDANGNPLGILFTITAGSASTGNITFTLRHEPNKPNNGLSDAGGETDIAVTFGVTIQ